MERESLSGLGGILASALVGGLALVGEVAGCTNANQSNSAVRATQPASQEKSEEDKELFDFTSGNGKCELNYRKSVRNTGFPLENYSIIDSGSDGNIDEEKQDEKYGIVSEEKKAELRKLYVDFWSRRGFPKTPEPKITRYGEITVIDFGKNEHYKFFRNSSGSCWLEYTSGEGEECYIFGDKEGNGEIDSEMLKGRKEFNRVTREAEERVDQEKVRELRGIFKELYEITN